MAPRRAQGPLAALQFGLLFTSSPSRAGWDAEGEDPSSGNELQLPGSLPTSSHQSLALTDDQTGPLGPPEPYREGTLVTCGGTLVTCGGTQGGVERLLHPQNPRGHAVIGLLQHRRPCGQPESAGSPTAGGRTPTPTGRLPGRPGSEDASVHFCHGPSHCEQSAVGGASFGLSLHHVQVNARSPAHLPAARARPAAPQLECATPFHTRQPRTALF